MKRPDISTTPAMWKVIFFLILAAIFFNGKKLEFTHVYAQETENTMISTEETKITLKRPAINKCTATFNSKITLSWNKVKNAQNYIIYRSKSKNGNYKEIGKTKKTSFTDKTGKQLTTYYYKIQACTKNATTSENEYSTYSKTVKKKVRKIAKKTAFVGDSITTGFSIYHVTGTSDKVFAKKGSNASTFYRSSLQKSMLKYKPDRMFLMFGMNGLPGNPSSTSMTTEVSYIGKIIKDCKKENPDMEIIILGVSPASSQSSVKLSSITAFNQKLKKSLKQYKNVHYYDTSQVLADKNGYLKSQYSGGDGIHWSVSAYKKVYQSLKEYVKKW